MASSSSSSSLLWPPGTRRMSKPQLHPPPPPSPAGSSDLDLPPEDDSDCDNAGHCVPIEIDLTFQREPTSDVRIVCGRNTFWTHGVLLRFSSEWFRSIIEGDWAESQPLSDSDSVMFPLPNESAVAQRRMSRGPSVVDDDALSQDHPASLSSADDEPASVDTDVSKFALASPVIEPPTPVAPGVDWDPERKDSQATVRVRQSRAYITITLPSVEAAPLHDFLHHVYPHLVLQVSWLNIEPLVHFASKYQIPGLLPILTEFLQSHAPGRPIAALALADTLALPDLYAEASRYVLDNLPHWHRDEYMTLGGETRWKLERRRGWFLDRVLKMGLVEVEKDYICHSSCPHPAQCAKTLDEKFRAAYATSFRFGAPQPSVVFRNLRCLSIPPYGYILPQTLCNETAKSWLANLFDRMFEIPLHALEGNKGRFFLTIKLASD